MKKSHLIKGAILITAAGIVSRLLGFLYRIFLSNVIGAAGMGLFQMVSPVFMLCISLSSGGIQIAISRFVAESSDNKSKCSLTLLSGLVLSTTQSVIVSYLLYTLSDRIANHMFNNPQCSDLLKIMTFAIPLIAIHSCITGFFLGLNKTLIPASAQIMEQLFKLFGLYIIHFYYVKNNIAISATLAASAMLFSEIMGSLFLLLVILITKKKYVSNVLSKKTPINLLAKKIYKSGKMLFSIAYILTLNRILLTIFHSIEAFLLPSKLMESGLNETEALSQYGILNGMALPVITFPSAIIGSLSLVLMPSIANDNVNNNKNSLKHTASYSIGFTCFCSIICCGLFLIFSDLIGNVLFNQELVVPYIDSLAWLAPFMYLSITFGSILHGLGKTKAAFIHNLISTLIRIFFTYFLVPELGMTAYFWGMLVSSLITTFLHAFVVSKHIKFDIPPYNCIIKPALMILLILGAGYILKPILFYFTNWLL